jgi:hypothetical protein
MLGRDERSGDVKVEVTWDVLVLVPARPGRQGRGRNRRAAATPGRPGGRRQRLKTVCWPSGPCRRRRRRVRASAEGVERPEDGWSRHAVARVRGTGGSCAAAGARPGGGPHRMVAGRGAAAARDGLARPGPTEGEAFERLVKRCHPDEHAADLRRRGSWKNSSSLTGRQATLGGARTVGRSKGSLEATAPAGPGKGAGRRPSPGRSSLGPVPFSLLLVLQEHVLRTSEWKADATG